MLEPEGRHLLLDALRPPAGYAFDRAVGTTFSLDLAALLTAPVGFALLDRETRDGRTATDPVALLEAVRRNADRIDIFCQAGLIGLPNGYQPIASYLEGAIHEVTAPRKGYIFHPKVWLIRYLATDEADANGPQRRYRLLCLSRNLTFDRSWDTVLRLDGEPTEQASLANEPLQRFVRSLPSMAVHPVRDEVEAEIEQLAGELDSVRFELPPGFDGLAFRPLGIEREPAQWPFETRVDRMLVVSPFVTEDCLERLDRPGSLGQDILVSRPETLDALGSNAVQRFGDTFTLSGDTAVADDDADEELREPAVDESNTDESMAEQPGVELRGLHAKLFVADQGHRATVWTGSANATGAAFSGNVEFLVELEGRKRDCGVDAVLGHRDGQLTLRSLLESYAATNAEPTSPTPQEQLEGRLEYIRRDLAAIPFVARVTATEGDHFRLRLAGEPPGGLEPRALADVTIRCRPLTAREAYAQPVDVREASISVDFGERSFDALTSFFAFELEAHDGGISASVAFVVNAKLVGAPRDRRARILVSLLQNRGDLLRFLLFLLGGEPDDQASVEAGLDLLTNLGQVERPEKEVVWQNVFEPMVRALAHDPGQLDDIDRLVRDLGKTEQGRNLLPDDWELIWEPIWAARQGLVTDE